MRAVWQHYATGVKHLFLAAFHVNNSSTFIVTNVMPLPLIILPLTARGPCYSHCLESHHITSYCLLVLTALQYHGIMRACLLCFPARFTLTRSIFHLPAASICLPLSGGSPARIEALGKALENSRKPTGESVGCRAPNTLENVRATFSRLIILKCSGWLTMSTVNYAHYTSKLL